MPKNAYSIAQNPGKALDVSFFVCYNNLMKRGRMGLPTKKRAVLCALNSQYVHVNLAVHYIKAYADAHSAHVSCMICEHTVNQPLDAVLRDICAAEPDIAAFSCYIWNITRVRELGEQLKARLPHTFIVLGGPEVSSNPDQYLALPWVDYVQCGEGERAMTLLFDRLAQNLPVPDGFGICYKNDSKSHLAPPFFERDLTVLESPYTAEYLAALPGRIAYVEASRGCPFSCAFFLSGACRGVRTFDMAYVKNALLLLWRSGARVVKFIDRTFNADVRRADDILSFLLAHYDTEPRGVCFHFEVAADLLAESTLALLAAAPVGFFQIEAGLQSFNTRTLAAVTRKTDLDKLCRNVRRVVSVGNVHTHVDLIAGLPYEDYAGFADSFDKAYALGADMLQLGFLKLLYGSALRDDANQYGFVFQSEPPYEIRATKWLTEEEVCRLKAAADACDKIHNSGRFRRSLGYVLDVTGMRPFDLFCGFGAAESMPLDAYTARLFAYFGSLAGVDRARLRDLLCCDRLSSGGTRLPDCLKIPDSRLALAVQALARRPDTAPTPGIQRTVCLLYSQRQAVYADFPPTDRKHDAVLHFVPFEALGID